MPRDVGREDADLAIRDLARGARVLPRDAATRLALLEEAGLVDHQHGAGLGQRLKRVLARYVAQRVRLPSAAAEDRLLAPWPRIARRLGAHPPRLAPLGSEQAIEEQPRRAGHALLREQRPHPHLALPQRRGPQLQRRLERCTAHRARSLPTPAEQDTA